VGGLPQIFARPQEVGFGVGQLEFGAGDGRFEIVLDIVFDGIARLLAALIVGSDERLKAFVLGLKTFVLDAPSPLSFIPSGTRRTFDGWVDPLPKEQFVIGVCEHAIDQKKLAAMDDKGVPIAREMTSKICSLLSFSISSGAIRSAFVSIIAHQPKICVNRNRKRRGSGMLQLRYFSRSLCEILH
jgi:hypothetical protein